MLRKLIVISAVLAAVLSATHTAHAIGVYADVPVQFKFTTDCTQDCTQSPTGLKAGVVLPSNVGIGLQNYTIHVNSAEFDYLLVDVSYLLPIPIVNISLGLGGGSFGVKIPGKDWTGRATNLWASVGIPIIPLFDLHVGYHKVRAAVHDNGLDIPGDGTMWSIGTLLSF